MLETIKDSGKPVGFKAAGGIRDLEQAQAYVQLAQTIMGNTWVSPQTFRLGAVFLQAAINWRVGWWLPLR